MLDIQNLLEQVFLTPDVYNIELKGTKVYLVQNTISPIHIGDLDFDVPFFTISLLKIKSWRLERDSDNRLSLALNLVI